MTTQDMLFYRRMGEGYPLILLHGVMVSGVMFSLKSVAEELSKSYDVIIPDLRGHGENQNMPGPYTAVQLWMGCVLLTVAGAINLLSITAFIKTRKGLTTMFSSVKQA